MSITLKRWLTAALVASLSLTAYILLSPRAGAEADLDQSEPPPPSYETRTDSEGESFMLIEDMPTTIEVLNSNGDVVGYSQPADIFGPPSHTPGGIELSARSVAVEEEGAPVYESPSGTGEIVGYLAEDQGYQPAP